MGCCEQEELPLPFPWCRRCPKATPCSCREQLTSRRALQAQALTRYLMVALDPSAPGLNLLARPRGTAREAGFSCRERETFAALSLWH